MPDPVSSSEARLLVLEMSVAALIAQLPQSGLEEVAGMLTYVAGLAEEATATIETGAGAGEGQLDHIRHWADQMLNRVMNSRKASRPKTLDPIEAALQRFADRRPL